MAKRQTRTYGGGTTTHFEKMGESLVQNVVNLSSERSPYTTTVPRKTQGRGASPTGVKKNKGAYQIREAHGPQFHISATLYAANAAEASTTQRNTRVMRAAVGDRDFWSARQFGQKTY